MLSNFTAVVGPAKAEELVAKMDVAYPFYRKRIFRELLPCFQLFAAVQVALVALDIAGVKFPLLLLSSAADVVFIFGAVTISTKMSLKLRQEALQTSRLSPP